MMAAKPASDPFAAFQQPAQASSESDPFAAFQEAAAPPPANAGEAKGLFDRAADNFRSNTQARPSDGTFGTALHNFGASAASFVAGIPSAVTALPRAEYRVLAEGASPQEVIDAVNPVKPIEQGVQQFREDYARDKPLAFERAAGTVAGAVVGAGLGEAGKMSAGALRAKAASSVRSGLQSATGAGAEATTKAATKIAVDADEAYAKTKAANQKTTELTQLDRAEVDQRNAAGRDKHAAAVEKNQKGNQAKLDAHREATARVQAENEANANAGVEREAVGKQIDEHAGELDRRLTAARAAAKTENDAKYAALRAKTANGTTSNAAIREAVDIAKQNDPVSSPIFNAILKRDGASAPLEPVTDSFGERVNPFDPDYEDLYQDQHGTAPPGMEGGDREIGFDQLHRFNTYLNNALSKGRGQMEAGQYNALKGVQDAVEASLDDIAKSTDAEDELRAARSSHRQFKQTFDDSPTERNTNQRQSAKETAPEYAAKKARDARRAAQGRYDPELPGLHERIDALRARHKELGRVKTEPKPLPEAPELTPDPVQPADEPYTDPAAEGKQRVGATPFERPNLDVGQIKKDLIQKATARWRETSQYQIRRLVAGGIGGAVTFATGTGFSEGAIGGYLTAEIAPKAVAALIERPKVLEWLARPTAEDIETIRKIPHADRTRIVDTLTREAVGAAREGRRVHLAPSVLALLGPANARQVQSANLPQNAGEARAKLAALR